jgi:cell wall-associated NlpC family hydrolase
VCDKTKVIGGAWDLVGTQFRMQGRAKSGVDCAGVVHQAYAAGGFNLKHESRYAWHSDYSILMTELLSEYFVKIAGPEAACVVTFSVKTRNKARHIGILVPVAGGFDLIHATQGTGKVVRETFGKAWRNKVVDYWGIKEWQQ